MSSSGAPASVDDRDLEVATTLARWMDGRFVDPLIGFLVPWGGDVASAALGLYPVWLAWRRGAPKVLIARMLLNLSVDLVGGLVPVVGDLWDLVFRAHSRNLALLRARRRDTEVRATGRDWLVVIAAALVFLAALATPVVLVVLAIRAFHH
jgi:Domain of unknown function (DUF4112)